jgi:GNAT superfamily N-acetyltransferase
MYVIRPARWPDDLGRVGELDFSFTTDRIYRVVRDELSFRLIDEKIDPPLHKDYGSVAGKEHRLPEMDCVLVAEREGELVGLATAEYEAWSRRLAVRHLLVAAGHRRSGIGRALLDHLEAFARSTGARCLWLDTQNINYPAIQFYRRVGFRLCGLDESFCDPAGTDQNEVALFFAREVT